MFNHLNISLPDCTEVTGKDGRAYQTPTGSLLPSVTTVLSYQPKEHLVKWKKRVGEVEANRIRDVAAGRGTALHNIIEQYLKNGALISDNYSALDMAGSLRKYLNKINNIHCQEQTLYSNKFGLAGRVDCIGEYDGVLSVVDFKQSNKPKKEEWIESYFIQATAYAGLYEDMTKTPIKQIVVMIAVENHKPQIFIKNPVNYVKPLIKAIKLYKLSVEIPT